MFRFNDEIRPYIMSLGNLMYYANSRDGGRWASVVFRNAMNTVEAILVEEFGVAFAAKVRNRINYGGNESFGDDIETAVSDQFADDTQEELDREAANLPEILSENSAH